MATNGTVVPDKMSLFQRNYLLQAWLGIVLALGFALALAMVQAYLGPVIENNKINETKQKVPELVLGDEQARKMASENRSLEITSHAMTVEKGARKKIYTVYQAKFPDGQTAGWVTKANGQGYADRIELLIGLDAEGRTVSGLFILDQKETPGLGNKIIEPQWRNQFIGKRTDSALTVVKGRSATPHDIDAVTGATISSRSVVDIVNSTVNDLRTRLSAQTGADAKE